MTLDELLLQNLARWRPHSPRQTLHVPHEGGWAVAVTADTVDSVGARLWEVRLSRSAPLEGALPLMERASKVASRVTGLLEPLRLIEVEGSAQLRSVAPARRGDDLFYYEVVLDPDGASSVRRYRGSRTGAKREQVPYSLTFESLAKLVTDLAD